MAITLLKKLTIHENKTFISDEHIAIILNAKEKILPLLRQFFKVHIHYNSALFNYVNKIYILNVYRKKKCF